MHFRPRFWGFPKILGFLSFSWKFWVGLCEIFVICSCIASSTPYNNVSCILGLCAWLNLWVLLGLDWVFPIMLLNFARHTFMHSSCIHSLFSFLFLACVVFCSFSLSLSLSLSLSHRLRYGTQTVQIYSCSEPPSRFWVILFYSISHSDPW